VLVSTDAIAYGIVIDTRWRTRWHIYTRSMAPQDFLHHRQTAIFKYGIECRKMHIGAARISWFGTQGTPVIGGMMFECIRNAQG
jgi:hypothetical protein